MLETPKYLKLFIQELISTELISEEEKLRMSSRDLREETSLFADPALEMDVRHLEVYNFLSSQQAQHAHICSIPPKNIEFLMFRFV